MFLQGPHGPFFHRLGKMLETAGAQVWRVGFNRGDRAFWPSASFIPFKGRQEDWPATIRSLLAAKAITDVVLYGDTRFLHAEAIRAARALGLTVHVFEEGYLRPYWVTYERGGSNGHSRLMDTGVPQMQAAQQLYRSLGFRPAAAYVFNPLEGATYMELDLSGPAFG